MKLNPQIGDVIEIKTPKGFAYAQYTHEHSEPPRMGSLLRVVDGEFETPQRSSQELVSLPTRFKVFFPLAAAIKKGAVRIIGHETVPPQDRVFPVFKNGVRDPRTGKVDTWWLWDGKREWRVGTLTEEPKKYPLRCNRPLIPILS
jgi:hypothetical protein